jgi:hypothetical protein
MPSLFLVLLVYHSLIEAGLLPCSLFSRRMPCRLCLHSSAQFTGFSDMENERIVYMSKLLIKTGLNLVSSAYNLAAITGINHLHSHFRMSNDNKLYTLRLFVCDHGRWCIRVNGGS